MMLGRVIPHAGAEVRRASRVHAQRRPLEMDRAHGMALPVTGPWAMALPATAPRTSRAQQVERLYRISLNMAMKMEASTRAMTAEEVPKSRPTTLVRRGSLPTLLAEALDPGKSKNCPSGTWCQDTWQTRGWSAYTGGCPLKVAADSRRRHRLRRRARDRPEVCCPQRAVQGCWPER